MIELEKVVKSLEICVGEKDFSACMEEKCPYVGGTAKGYCITNLQRDALALIKEQAEKIKSLEQTEEDNPVVGVKLNRDKSWSAVHEKEDSKANE